MTVCPQREQVITLPNRVVLERVSRSRILTGRRGSIEGASIAPFLSRSSRSCPFKFTTTYPHTNHLCELGSQSSAGRPGPCAAFKKQSRGRSDTGWSTRMNAPLILSKRRCSPRGMSTRPKSCIPKKSPTGRYVQKNHRANWQRISIHCAVSHAGRKVPLSLQIVGCVTHRTRDTFTHACGLSQ